MKISNILHEGQYSLKILRICYIQVIFQQRHMLLLLFLLLLKLLMLMRIPFRPISAYTFTFQKYSRRFPLLFARRAGYFCCFVVLFFIFNRKHCWIFHHDVWCDIKPFPFVQFISRPSTLITCHLCNFPPQKNVNFIFPLVSPPPLPHQPGCEMNFSFELNKKRIASEGLAHRAKENLI